MSDDVFVYAAVYADRADADADYDTLLDLHSADLVGTYDVALMYRDEDGKVHVTKHEKPTQHGAWTGAAVGALVGIIFPPSLIGAAVVGAAAGGGIGHALGGMSRSDAKELGEQLWRRPGGIDRDRQVPRGRAARQGAHAGAEEREREIDASARELRKELDRRSWPARTGERRLCPPPCHRRSSERRLSSGARRRRQRRRGPCVARQSRGVGAVGEARRIRSRCLRSRRETRVPELVPIRYGRMLASPFTFFRGAAAIMAMDLAETPESGLRVQACGDAHLANFGIFAAPDRSLVFDVNDFDETLPGPWEWDVKRLAASFEIAGRGRDFTPKETRAAVLRRVRAYREAMREFAAMGNLEVWYARVDVDTLLGDLTKVADPKQMKAARKSVAKAGKKNSFKAFERLARVVDGEPRIVSDPPLLVPVARAGLRGPGRGARGPDGRDAGRYRESLNGDRRHLFDGYRFVEVARKVVGVGSVGTRAWVVLMMGRDGQDPLFLQAKEADASVLEPYAGKSEFGNHGERVVEGQWLMQAASDILLGWLPALGMDGRERDFYVRQLWDGKRSVEVEILPPEGARDLRPGLRQDARPRPRPLRRPDRHRRLPRQGRDLRPRDRRLLRALRRPERTRLRRPRRRGQIRPHQGRNRPDVTHRSWSGASSRQSAWGAVSVR